MAIFAIGCSSGGRDAGTVPVSGKVTYKGEPVAGATVTFVSDASATPGAGLTAGNGIYTLRVKPGNYTVMVSKTDVPIDTADVSMEQAAADADNPRPEPKDLLPAKYKTAADSPLKYEVKSSGQSTYDAELSD